MKHPSNLITAEVRARIRSMILANELAPGRRLVEDELAAQLDVGRTPLREALLLLQGEGLIARRRGWEVQGVDHLQVRTIFESRAALESATARLASQRLNACDCDALDALIDQMDICDDRQTLNRLNNEFHQRIIAGAKNDILTELHERTEFYYWALRVPVLFSDTQRHATNLEHRELVAALRERDPARAEHIARHHVEATMAIVMPVLEG
jgi:DNA-binding GntR family transcriptional regulator